NLVIGNYIGTDPSGTLDRGNSNLGIFISLSNSNTIGGTAAAARNVISGNDGGGIRINNSTTGNLIAGNYIGTDFPGTAAIPNPGDGVFSVGSGTTIGGLTDDGTAAHGPAPGTAPGNVIIGGARLANNGDLVAGNLIGLDRTGTVALSPGLGTGVTVDGAGNTVGGLSPNARNIISGNGDGIFLGGASAANNLVLNNYIGTDITGAVGQGNTGYGVYIYAAGANNPIGAPRPGNVVAAHRARGVFIAPSPRLIVH